MWYTLLASRYGVHIVKDVSNVEEEKDGEEKLWLILLLFIYETLGRRKVFAEPETTIRQGTEPQKKFPTWNNAQPT